MNNDQFYSNVYLLQIEVNKISDCDKRHEANKYAAAFTEGRTPFEYAMNDIKALQLNTLDKVKTKAGAGGLLAAGLIATILIINGHDLFVRIDGNSYHVKANEIELI